jgi:uncharacterized surface protein with fasciclin (FAS1) repeats
MRLSRRAIALACATGMTAALGLTAAPAAQAHGTHLKSRSLAAVLTSDGNTFDRNAYDYDVLTQAVLTVIAAKPSSPVTVLTDGKTPLTAFLPNDLAFERLVKDLTGSWPKSERAAFTAVAGLGIDTVETVLLYHVVAGVTITKRQALRSDGAKLTTAQGGVVRVDVTRRHRIVLIDADRDDADPVVVAPDINRGNRQIAHGISRVLRPVDL